jgi:hypothetical protein
MTSGGDESSTSQYYAWTLFNDANAGKWIEHSGGDLLDETGFVSGSDLLLGGQGIIISAGQLAIDASGPEAQGDIVVPYDCTITAVTLLSDQSGSIAVDLWVDSYANFPPTDADSITASAVPTISAAAKYRDTTLTGWTTALAAGDIIRYNVDSASTITRCTMYLTVTK